MKSIRLINLYLLIACFIFISCATKRTRITRDTYPNNQLKTYQKVSTYQKCREHCRIVKTKKTKIEYYENGNIKSREWSTTETTLDGEFTSQKIESRLYGENGKIVKKVKRDELKGKVSVYDNGKLISKNSFDQ